MVALNDERYLTRREWEWWLESVYTYRHTEIEKEIASIIAVMTRLERVTGHLEEAASQASKAATTARYVTNSWWTRLLGIAVILTPFTVVVIGHFWK